METTNNNKDDGKVQENITAQKFSHLNIKDTDRIKLYPKDILTFDWTKTNQKIAWKPDGLWYSVGMSWIEWCDGNMPSWLAADHVFLIEMDFEKILIIDTPEKFSEFEQKYGLKRKNLGYIIDTMGKRNLEFDDESFFDPLPDGWEKTTETDFPIISFSLGSSDVYINWPKIVSEYSGIEIAPYFWEFRLNRLWYYGWDAASGCIWNEDAIKSITKLM